jgi:uncharacterized membrane protein YfcA
MLHVAWGSLVGLALAWTGGGGALLAVPLLAYGLDMPTRAAVGVSLATVGVTAAVGCGQRMREHQVELPTGVLFAAAGMVAAPLDGWLGKQAPEALVLALFGGLMLTLAARRWRRADDAPLPCPVGDGADDRPHCRRDPAGRLRLTSRCAAVLAAAGLATGLLSGLFGVGGGFLIVLARRAVSGMGMQRAVGASLLAIALVSGSSIVSQLLAGETIPAAATAYFLAGSLLGLAAGSRGARWLSGPRWQRIFAAALTGVGIGVVVQNSAAL